MRVADKTTARTYLDNLFTAKNNVAKTNNQLSSGNRFINMDEDVASGTKVLYSRNDLYKTQTQRENVETISDELTVVEDVMMNISDILTQAHELNVKAMNDTTEGAARDIIATEIRNLKEQVLTYANTKYGDKFLYGGSNSSTNAPFTQHSTNGNLLYNGIDVDKILRADTEMVSPFSDDPIKAGSYYYLNAADEPVPVPMDEDVYMDVGLGIKIKEDQIDEQSVFQVNYSGMDVFGFGVASDGQPNNIFNILNDLEKAIDTENEEAMREIDTHLLNLSDSYRKNITDIGAKTKLLDSMVTRLTDMEDAYKIKIDNLMGTNEEEAIISLEIDYSVLSMVQNMGSRLLPSSLMDFLK